MIYGKTVLAIIPARGGSKGIPRKNIKLLAGKPLIAWTIEEAKKSKYVDRLILSSEDEEIIKVARELSCEVPFIRPKELSEDEIPGIEPVIHAISNLEEKYDFICLLQPTSPLRRVEDIDGCIEKCIINNAESCVSVSEVSHHPYWMYMVDEKEKLKPLFLNNIATRQKLPKVFELNGALYLIKTDSLLKERELISENTLCFIMDKSRSVDIDSEVDFETAEYYINKLSFT